MWWAGTYLDASGKPAFYRMPTGKLLLALEKAREMGFRVAPRDRREAL